MTPVPKNIAKNKAKLLAYKRALARGFSPRVAAAYTDQNRQYPRAS
jgi:hypothetical protein